MTNGQDQRRVKELEELVGNLEDLDHRYLDIVVKANDGRGRGHIGRVSNFVGYKPLLDRIVVVVNRDFVNMVPKHLSYLAIEDSGFRVDLDPLWSSPKGKPNIYVKYSPKRNGRQNINVFDAVARYYVGLMLSVTENTHLVYLDDQNSPETLFMSEVGKVIQSPLSDIKTVAPNTYIALEMETQEIFRPSMSEAFKAADYIHLSSSVEFLVAAMKGTFSVNGYNDKVIPMGLPLSEMRKKQLSASPEFKARYKQELFDKYTNGKCNKFIYSSFGAGEGAESIADILYDVAKNNQDKLFAITDPEGALIKGFDSVGIKVKQIEREDPNEEGSKDRYIVEGDDGLSNLYINLDTGDHLKAVACADLLMQGCGSGTTYEGMYSGNPIICLPLKRPGHEQVIKAMGVKNLGCGEILIPEDIYDSDTVEFMKIGGIEAEALTANNLNTTLNNILSSENSYNEYCSALQNAKGLFGTEQVMGQTMYLMAEHKGPGEIRDKLGLKRL